MRWSLALRLDFRLWISSHLLIVSASALVIQGREIMLLPQTRRSLGFALDPTRDRACENAKPLCQQRSDLSYPRQRRAAGTCYGRLTSRPRLGRLGRPSGALMDQRYVLGTPIFRRVREHHAGAKRNRALRRDRVGGKCMIGRIPGRPPSCDEAVAGASARRCLDQDVPQLPCLALRTAPRVHTGRENLKGRRRIGEGAAPSGPFHNLDKM
jgi:hypothetical protein